MGKRILFSVFYTWLSPQLWALYGRHPIQSNVLYLAVALQIEVVAAYLASPVAVVGPLLVLTGLVMMGFAVITGFRGEVVGD